MQDFNQKRKKVIEDIKKHLRNSDYNHQGKLQIEESTAYAAKFKIKVSDEWISVDLLPAYDNLGKTGNIYVNVEKIIYLR